MSNNHCGLINNGNFCYIISAIQNLKFSKSIIRNLTDEDEHEEDLKLLLFIKNSNKEYLEKNQLFIKKAVFYLNFKKLIINMCSSTNDNPISMIDFLKSCHRLSLSIHYDHLFSGAQNCSGEVIHFLLDMIHDLKKKNDFEFTFNSLDDCQTDNDKILYEYENSLKNHFTKNSWIIDEFNITLSQKTCCSKCNYTRITYDPNFLLPLPIPLNIDDCTIEDCLDFYIKKEILEDNEAWTCDKCNNKLNNYRQIKFFNSPSTLIIQFNRFKYNYQMNISEKITKQIKFNDILNIKNYKLFKNQGSHIYKLQSVLCHQGHLNSGHYYTYCRDNNDFYLFNDEIVRKCDDFPLDKNAYILFYEKL